MSEMPEISALKRISIASLGDKLKPQAGPDHLVNKMGAVRYRDAYLIKQGEGEAWIFDYGVLVAWDLSENNRLKLCDEIKDFIEGGYDRPLMDQYSYKRSDDMTFTINHESIELPNDEPLTRLALSHAFAQSAKLDFFEEKAQRVIQDNAYISKSLAQHGKVPLRRRELAKLRGVLFDTSSDIALHFNLLDTPEFFWDYPELEEFYQRLAKYLDVGARLNVLDKKLETIQNLLDMLATEQNHKHSSFLEWVIIILIAVDIVVYFV